MSAPSRHQDQVNNSQAESSQWDGFSPSMALDDAIIASVINDFTEGDFDCSSSRFGANPASTTGERPKSMDICENQSSQNNFFNESFLSSPSNHSATLGNLGACAEAERAVNAFTERLTGTTTNLIAITQSLNLKVENLSEKIDDLHKKIGCASNQIERLNAVWETVLARENKVMESFGDLASRFFPK
ncbi:hypothetical protein N7532_001397 [Penicillium argentinense]|uniref:Uncharacterized protein n=1 Tax=Penicillium argentinense TaxID=1131581 RepID=A0A9W9G2I7_9EURO|nr:uncharacterized protein N7532_001397 [Penicillium argentinense]KAJ5110862.1 hypothetical protein N7532_001397 [Penicillium argentinense]